MLPSQKYMATYALALSGRTASSWHGCHSPSRVCGPGLFTKISEGPSLGSWSRWGSAGAAAAAVISTRSTRSIQQSGIRVHEFAHGGAPNRHGVARRAFRVPWFQGISGDMRRRWRPRSYVRDWADGLRFKSVATVIFMFFACFAPVVAFGELTGLQTGGVLGVHHFIAAACLCGVAYPVFAGQPMTMLGPTGLTFAYVTALSRLCSAQGWPFLSLYAWTGLWCSAALATLSCSGACGLVAYVTRFTDDVFNGLIVMTFLGTAFSGLLGPFLVAGADKTVAFMDAVVALGTFALAGGLSVMRKTPFFSHSVRCFLSDFGPALAILGATFAARSPFVSSIADLRGLSVPGVFTLGRDSLLVPLLPCSGVPAWVPLVAAPPALLLAMLFFLDQNITSRVVNKPEGGLRKGATYHLDLLLLASLVAVCSILGLPWQCAATVQSLNHVRSMSLGGGAEDSDMTEGKDGAVQERTQPPPPQICETRLTGAAVHGLIGCSVVLLPLLKQIPASAITGLFFYLGVKMIPGNAFLARLRLLFYDPALVPREELRGVRLRTAHLFTALQVATLSFLWWLRSMPSTALLFPSGILLLVFLRLAVAPRLFREEVLLALDEPVSVANAALPGVPENDSK